MNNKKNEGKSLTSSNSLNNNNSPSNSLINPGINKIHKDLLFFKNDMLLDLRKVEEKFNAKLTEQTLTSSKQYDSFDKKLIELDERISKVNSLILDNNELVEKIKTFLRFQTKTEDNFNWINTKINSIQKYNIDSIYNIERIINENLKYPGVIGKNERFSNFRFFIDYTMKNFNDFKNFRDEIKHFNFNELKSQINKDISDFRYSISNNYKNSVNLIGNKLKEVDKKIEDLLKRNNNNMKENEAKFEELKNNIDKYFSEYQTKFESLEKNINDKYNDQLHEINNVKNIKDELLTEINNVKCFFEKIKSLNNNNTNNDNNNDNNNINSCRNKKNIQDDDNNNFVFQTISTSNKKYNMFTNKLIKNNNINLLDSYQHSVIQNNTDLSSNKMIRQNVLDESKSFGNLLENHNLKIGNKNKELSLEHYEIEKKEEKKKFDQYFNTTNKDFRRNNYSISNIANINIKKVIFPNNVSKRNINRTLNSLSPENKGTILISNDLSSNIPQKNMYFNDNCNSMRKDIFNISKIKQQKLTKSKNRNRNLFHSAKPISRTVEVINSEKINSLLLIKSKSKNNIFKNLDLFKRGKKYNMSFEKKKNSKDEQSQIRFRKAINLTNKFKELHLINQRNFKKNRTIEL